MRLADLFDAGADVEVSGLAYDSRRVRPGDLFFCVPGFRRDGHEFAPQAVSAGAAALVVERQLDVSVPQAVVPSVRPAMAPAAARFYGEPSTRLPVVGITGTNGKTTTAFLLRAMLEAADRPCGLIGTVRVVIGGEEREASRTTPEAIDVQRDLRAMLDGGDRGCAMEVSSVGLALHRADAIRFAGTVFTNLTEDHLDFHVTMDEYFEAKRRLFAGPAPAIVNADDPYGRRLIAELDSVTTFALDADANLRATDVRTTPTGSSFTVVGTGPRLALQSPLPGRFNVYNVLAAVASARALGVDDESIAAGVRATDRVPGRFEAIDEGQPFAVVIDYAHSPDSLENALSVLRDRAGEGRLVCVFGATGERFRQTRGRMGQIARRLADVLVVTSDNPNVRDPEAIEEISAGAGGDAEAVADRREGIDRAIELAESGDTVVIVGGEFPVQDGEMTRASLRSVAPTHSD